MYSMALNTVVLAKPHRIAPYIQYVRTIEVKCPLGSSVIHWRIVWRILKHNQIAYAFLMRLLIYDGRIFSRKCEPNKYRLSRISFIECHTPHHTIPHPHLNSIECRTHRFNHYYR